MANNWQYRIQQHKELPPEALWNRIANELDQSAAQSTSERLQQYQENPPEEIWQKIADSLTEAEVLNVQEETTTTSFKIKPVVRRFNWFKIGAAAGIMLLIISTFFWLNLRKLPDAQVFTPKQQAPNNQLQAVPSNNATVLISPGTKPSSTKNFQPAQHPSSNTIDSSLLQLLQVTTTPIHVQPMRNPADDGEYKNVAVATNVFPTEVNQPYFTITGPDGETVRVSSKLKNIAPLLSERDPASEENIDLIIKNSAGWKLKLKDWKDRMLQLPIATSPANLMSIVELGKMLEEKEN